MVLEPGRSQVSGVTPGLGPDQTEESEPLLGVLEAGMLTAIFQNGHHRGTIMLEETRAGGNCL